MPSKILLPTPLPANRPSRCPRPTRSARHIPAHVRRAVRERDGCQCSFVSDTGHRCQARKRLEFDHIEPVARGGEATAANTRLLCRAHNQYEAERTYGAEFMRHKRTAPANAQAEAMTQEDRDIINGLMTLGYKERQAREAAAFSRDRPHDSLEERMRVALSWFRPKVIGCAG